MGEAVQMGLKNASPSSGRPRRDRQLQRPNFHPLTPTYFLPRAVSIDPKATAIVHVNRNQNVVRLSYQEVADRARGLAYYLKMKGYKRVGILAPNTPAFLESVFGIGGAGGVNVAINYRLVAEDILYIFTHADVDAVIVDREYASHLNSFRRERPLVEVIEDVDSDIPGPFDDIVQTGWDFDMKNGNKGWDGLDVHPESEHDLIALAYTSGTTAKPKGVEFLHRGAYLASLAHVSEYGLTSPKDTCRFLWTLPMFHAMGWCCVWAVTAARGTHICLRKIEYPTIWRLLTQERVTHFCAAPTVNSLLCNAREAERLALPVQVMVGASPPTPSLFEQMTSLNLHPNHVYGMTETYGPVTKAYYSPAWDMMPSKDKYRQMARQGHTFLASLAVRVVKHGGNFPEDEAEEEVVDVARNGKEVGEVVMMGNICTNGYHKDQEATRKLFAGGVLHSGDLAVWHADGSIQILDRAKDIIISGGENISSIALESLLAAHPDVLEVAVVAVPDARWGERPKAFVTAKQKPGAKRLRGHEVLEWSKSAASGISGFMVPREIEVVDELPKTHTGKIQKNVLRQQLLMDGHGRGSSSSSSSSNHLPRSRL